MNLKFKLYQAIANLQVENVTYLRGRGLRYVTVCDRGGVKFDKSSMCMHYGQPMISKDYNQATQIGLQYINFQQILFVTFEFTGAARGFMIMSCAARLFKKVGQHWIRTIEK